MPTSENPEILPRPLTQDDIARVFEALHLASEEERARLRAASDLLAPAYWIQFPASGASRPLARS